MLTRREKEQQVEQMADTLARANTLLVIDYLGLSVQDANALRRQFRAADGEIEYRVAKNTLLRRAVQGTSAEGLLEFLTGPSALAISYDEPSAVAKVESSYQHIEPEKVGNAKRVTVSELAGRSNVLAKANDLGIDVAPHKDVVKKVVEQIKSLESQGYAFEAAEASFELLLRRALPDYKQPFELVDFIVLVERRRRAPSKNNGEETLSEATVKVKVDGVTVHMVAEGDGPVNALDGALRRGLVQFYPGLSKVTLADYKVRIIDEHRGTESVVRVLIDSTDGERHWSTVGSSTNIIDASWTALADSMEYWLLKYGQG